MAINNVMKFVCECKTTVFLIEAKDAVKLTVHGDVKVICGVCGKERQYASGTGGNVSVSEGGTVTVQQ